MATNIGIMDSAYFVGRNEILGWINDRLHLNLSRIEEVYIYLLFLHVFVSMSDLFSLVVHCQIKRTCLDNVGGLCRFTLRYI